MPLKRYGSDRRKVMAITLVTDSKLKNRNSKIFVLRKKPNKNITNEKDK
jgi:hypothetical protein